MTVLIKLIIGLDGELFNLYSDTDGYSIPFEVEIPKSYIIEGITSLLVPVGTTTIRVSSIESPINYLDTPVNSINNFNFTSKIPPPPSFI